MRRAVVSLHNYENIYNNRLARVYIKQRIYDLNHTHARTHAHKHARTHARTHT